MSNIDANRQTVGLAYNGTNTQPLKVDPSTGRLKIVVVDGNGSGTRRTSIPRDANKVPVACGVTDDANNTVTAFQTNTSGDLLVDIA